MVDVIKDLAGDEVVVSNDAHERAFFIASSMATRPSEENIRAGSRREATNEANLIAEETVANAEVGCDVVRTVLVDDTETDDPEDAAVGGRHPLLEASTLGVELANGGANDPTAPSLPPFMRLGRGV